MPTEAQIALKVLSDYWLLATAIVMLAGVGLKTLADSWINRNNPSITSLVTQIGVLATNIDSMARAIEKDAEAERGKIERDNALLQKLVNHAIGKESNG